MMAQWAGHGDLIMCSCNDPLLLQTWPIVTSICLYGSKCLVGFASSLIRILIFVKEITVIEKLNIQTTWFLKRG